MIEADPFAPEDAREGVVVFECDQDAAHGDIAEDNRQQEGRHNKEQIQLPVLPDIHHAVMQLGVSACLGNCARRWFTHIFPPFHFIRRKYKQIFYIMCLFVTFCGFSKMMITFYSQFVNNNFFVCTILCSFK